MTLFWITGPVCFVLWLAGEAWMWRKRANEWRNVARLTAIIADELIEIHDPDHDEVSAEAREQLRRVREGVIA